MYKKTRVANGVHHSAPGRQTAGVVGTISGKGFAQNRNSGRVQYGKALFELQKIRTVVFAVAKLQDTLFCVFRVMMHIETGGIIPGDFCRQSVGADDMLTHPGLKFVTGLIVFTQNLRQPAQPVVSGIFFADLPACSLLENRFVLADPRFHARKMMRQRMQNIGYEQNRQLPITQLAPVPMVNPGSVDDLLNIHFLKNCNDKRYCIDSLYLLGHHKPPGYEFYDDHDMAGSACPGQSLRLIQNRF
jgi:hypothetical protein